MFDEFRDMLTVAEVSVMLRICPGKNKAYELLRKGMVRGFKESRVWKIPKQAVVDYIHGRSK